MSLPRVKKLVRMQPTMAAPVRFVGRVMPNGEVRAGGSSTILERQKWLLRHLLQPCSTAVQILDYPL